MLVLRSSSIRWIRFSSLVSSAFELLYTNSILINKNVTRVKEVTEIAKGILLIFSVDFVRTFLFASISVLAIFKTAEEEYSSLVGTDVAQKRKWRWNYPLSAELFKCTPYSLKYHLHSCQTIQIKFLKRRSLNECSLYCRGEYEIEVKGKWIIRWRKKNVCILIDNTPIVDVSLLNFAETYYLLKLSWFIIKVA